MYLAPEGEELVAHLGLGSGRHEDSSVGEDEHLEGILGVASVFDVNGQHLV